MKPRELCAPPTAPQSPTGILQPPKAPLGSCQPPSLAHVPLSRALPPFPGHYIIIHLHHAGHIIDTKETKTVSGYNPVWNAPFLFSIPTGDVQQHELALEFIVMQVRR